MDSKAITDVLPVAKGFREIEDPTAAITPLSSMSVSQSGHK